MQDGKTDYKSVTVASNATAEEFMDFYFDDNVRMKWVSATELNSCIQKQQCRKAAGNDTHNCGRGSDPYCRQLWSMEGVA